ncbi:MAG: treY [Solirubrobacteraceae bacterium]|nr:treY [Solirubrobacteraceae bacterium]
MSEVRATYRLQLGPDLTFAGVRELVPYLAELGVSHLYLSPSFEARAGSTHGYDVIDPRRLSAALGGEEAFRALAATAREAGLGIVLDIVPNHMAADDANPFWADEQLRERFFDIDPETGFARRFFDIDHLVGVRVEDPEVFETTHALALSLVVDGAVDGLRIDHPDGLADPASYLRRLADRGVSQVWVEKILDPGERLRASWPVSGTTGYEFLNDVIGVFVDPVAEEELTKTYCRLAGDARAFGDIAEEAKAEQAAGTFSREVDWLERLWPDAPGDVASAVAALPVYRTYADGDGWSDEDVGVLREAGSEWVADGPTDFVTRFQQTTPPVMAKGVEDTAFYRYGRLLALNDVGGDPSRFGVPVAQLHEANEQRARDWPAAMLTLQTHDTKRSADVRARLAALTWLADEFVALAEAVVPSAPEPGEGWFFLQTVVAAPVGPDRLRAYVEKALRERKWTSTWAAPDEAHEQAVADWVVGLEQREDVTAFAARLASVAAPIVLGQKLLQLTAPGVPDVYQGDEDEFVALVDPDNRRPVDWAALRTGSQSPKLALTRAALGLGLAPGMDYEPRDAAEGVIAYCRDGGRVFVAVAVRPGAELPEPPAGSWRELFSAPGVLLCAKP